MTGRRSLERRVVWLAIAIGSGVLICGATVVGGLLVAGAVAFSDTDHEDVAPAVVESVARIRLPAGARELRSHLEGFQDQLIWVRFRMPESELGSFERSLSCRLAPPSSASPQLPATSRPPWWTDVKLSRSCHGSGAGFNQTVIVDLATAPDLLVFVVVFET
jgi:hypothetical protein